MRTSEKYRELIDCNINEYLNDIMKFIYESPSQIFAGRRSLVTIIAGRKLFHEIAYSSVHNPSHPGHVVKLDMHDMITVELCEEMIPGYFRTIFSEEIERGFRYDETTRYKTPFEYQRLRIEYLLFNIKKRINLMEGELVRIEDLRKKHARLQKEADDLLDEIEKAEESSISGKDLNELKKQEQELKTKQNDFTGGKTKNPENPLHGQNKQRNSISNDIHQGVQGIPGQM